MKKVDMLNVNTQILAVCKTFTDMNDQVYLFIFSKTGEASSVTDLTSQTYSELDMIGHKIISEVWLVGYVHEVEKIGQAYSASACISRFMH